MPTSTSLVNIKKTRLLEYFLYVLIIIGSIIGIISNFIMPKSKNINELLQTSVVGYICAIFGLLFIMAVSIKFNNMKLSALGMPTPIFSSYIIYSLPALLTLIIMIYICVVLLSYKNRLVSGNVADEYYKYSNASTILLGIQSVILIYHLYQQSQFSQPGKKHILKSTSNYSIYILTVLNIVLIGISQIILQFFSTDG